MGASVGVRVLESESVPATSKPTVWVDGEPGDRKILTSDRGCLAAEDQDCYARAARFAIASSPLVGKSVAWIGGGLCVGPRLFAIADCTQDVYEIEPSLREFCPQSAVFVSGGWEDTLNKMYDLIIWDIDDNPPYAKLARWLSPNGKIIPLALNPSKDDT